MIDKLLVYPARMQANLDRHGRAGPFAARAARADPGRGQPRGRVPPGPAQRDEGWDSDGKLSLLELLKADPEVTAALSPAELEEKFDLDYHFRQVDRIFARVFG